MSIFKSGVVPRSEQTPPEHTHARAKIIYALLKGVLALKKDHQAAALREIKEINPIIHDRVKEYLSKLTPEQIAFYKGNRPWFNEDGTLAIYDPIKDNPVLMAVYKGEQPADGRKVIVARG